MKLEKFLKASVPLNIDSFFAININMNINISFFTFKKCKGVNKHGPISSKGFPD